MRMIWKEIATCGPIGKIPFAPGTFGSLMAMPFIVVCRGHFELQVCLLVLLTMIGVYSSGIAAQELGSSDPSSVVIDEVIGMFVSMMFVSWNLRLLVIGFILFRVFDVIKPPPIRALERLPGGMGICMDDVLAGIYTNVILWLLVIYAKL